MDKQKFIALGVGGLVAYGLYSIFARKKPAETEGEKPTEKPAETEGEK